MKRILSLMTVLVAAVFMNASALMAQVTNLEFVNSYFEDNTNITETAWSKKNINFTAFTANKSHKANVKINTDHVAGHYTIADCAEYYVYITDLASYDSYYPTEAEIDVTEEGNTVNLTADFVTPNGNFHFTINYVKQEKVDINMGGISIYDYSKPTYNVSGENSNYTINLSLTSTADDGNLADGEYELGEWDNIYNKTFGASVYFQAGSKVAVENSQSWNGDPCVNITGEVMGKNGQKYAINITSGLAEPDYMLQANDDEAVTTCEFREEGRWSLEGKTQNVLVHMQLSREDYAGVYDMKKWNFGYDNYVTIAGTKMSLSDAHIVVEDLGEKINATGWVMAEDNGEIYYVAIDFTADKAVEPAAAGDAHTDVDVAFTEYTITSDWMWGGWIVDAENAQGYSLHLVSGTYWMEGENLEQGVYNVTNDWEEMLRVTPSTYLESAGGDWGPLRAAANGKTPNGSYVADANGNFWFIYKGTVTVSYEEDGLNIVCDCVNTAGKKVQVAVGANAVSTAIMNVINAEVAKAKKVVKNGKVVIELNGKAFNAAGAAM